MGSAGNRQLNLTQMSNPRVLLMDEPSERLAPQIVAEVMATIRRPKRHGLSIVLVEQKAKLVFDAADTIVILGSSGDRVGGSGGSQHRKHAWILAFWGLERFRNPA